MRPALPVVLLPTGATTPAHEPARRQPAAYVAPSLALSFAGVWDGALYADESGASVAFSLMQNGAGPQPRSASADDGAAQNPIVGRAAFAGRDDAVAAAVRLLEASATTYVALVGPYYDAAADAQVVTLLDGRRSGERMWGTFRTRPVAGGAAAVEGRFVAVKTLRAAA